MSRTEDKSIDIDEINSYFNKDDNIINFSKNNGTDYIENISANITCENDVYNIYADLCGVNKEDIELQLTGKILKISAKRDLSKSDAPHKNEIICGDLLRIIHLDSDIDTKNIKATFVNGLLTINLKKNFENDFIKIAID